MLIKCPKCGFVQPDDQFCARCGVDVKAFQQRPTPFAQRITGHPLFWAGLFLLVVVGTFGYLRVEKQNELLQRKEYLKKGPQFIASSPPAESPVALSQAESLASNQVRQTAEEDPILSSGGNKDTGSGLPQASLSVTDAKQVTQVEPSMKNNKPTHVNISNTVEPEPLKSRIVNVIFFETYEEQISRAMDSALQKGALPIDFGDYRSSPLFTKMTSPGWNRLKSKRVNLSSSSLDSRWIEGSLDPEMGFMLNLSLSGLSFPLQAELELIRVIPEDAASELMPMSYPSTLMDIVSGQTQWMISIRLPRTVSKSALQILKDPIFNIFTSDSFLKMKSEFTLVLDFGTQ